jgi:putative hydrolase of the HAD superfamily
MSEALAGRIDAVLLDAGGVLLDLDYAYLRRLIERCGPAVELDALSRAEALARRQIDGAVRQGGRIGDSWRAYFRFILDRVGLAARWHEETIDALWEAHRRFGLWTVAGPEAREIVDELRRRGFRLGVVSNAEGQVARDLDNAGFAGSFETVVDSSLVGVEKPDPEIFRIALERMNLRPEHAVFLGDLPAVDVEGARAAGLRPVLLDRHDLYPEVRPRVRSLMELAGMLGRRPPLVSEADGVSDQ